MLRLNTISDRLLLGNNHKLEPNGQMVTEASAFEHTKLIIYCLDLNLQPHHLSVSNSTYVLTA